MPTLIKKTEVLAGTSEQAQGYLTGVEVLVAAFGFLNIFGVGRNDITGQISFIHHIFGLTA
ncbi:MAG: hypothetical protein AAFZ49_00555 [Cyanobacteria bacterium J06659_2]